MSNVAPSSSSSGGAALALAAAWSALVSSLESAASSSAPTGESKLLIARVLIALDAAPISTDSQRVMLFLRSVCDADESVVDDDVYMDRDVSTLFPFLSVFFSLLGRPTAAESDQRFFGGELQRGCESYITLIRRKARERKAIQCITLDLEECLQRLLPSHIAFCSSVRDGESAFETGHPYHAATIEARAGGNTHAPFTDITLPSLTRFRQFATCRCCRRIHDEEMHARSNANAAQLLPPIPPCTCTLDGVSLSCSCQFPSSFLSQSSPPPRLVSHPLFSFFTFDFQLHSNPLLLRISSTQQLRFYTEKILGIYLFLIDTQPDDPPPDDADTPTFAHAAIATIDRLHTLLSYASLPDATLRGIAMQILSVTLDQTPDLPAHTYATIMEFTQDAIAARVRRGERFAAREPTIINSSPDAYAEVNEDDQRLNRLLSSIFRRIPIESMQPYAPRIIQSFSRCMGFTHHPPLLYALIRIAADLLRRFPHSLFTFSEFYLAAIQHTQRIAAAQPVQVSPCIDSLLVFLSRQLFQSARLTAVWQNSYADPTYAPPTHTAVRPSLSEEKYLDMPGLERGSDRTKTRAHGISEEENTNPSKRAKIAHSTDESTSASVDQPNSPPYDSPLSSVSSSSVDPSLSLVVDMMHPVFHTLLHAALPNPTHASYVHPSNTKPTDALIMLTRLSHAARILCASVAGRTIDGQPVLTSPACQRLSANLNIWLVWLNTLASSQQAQITGGSTPTHQQQTYFAILPNMMRHMYAILEHCVASLPIDFFDSYRISLHHLCAWPLEAESTKNIAATAGLVHATPPNPPFPLSCLIASMRLLALLPVHDVTSECRLMSVALESRHPAVQSAAILLLPTFIARFNHQDRRTKGKTFLTQLARMAVSDVTTTTTQPPLPATTNGVNVHASIAASVGALICAITSHTISVGPRVRAPESASRTRHASFLPLRLRDATLNPHTRHDQQTQTPTEVIDTTADANAYFDLDELDRPVESDPALVADPDSNSQLSGSQHRSRSTPAQPTLFNLAVSRFLAPLKTRFFCSHCDGTHACFLAAPTSQSIISAQDVLPFCTLLHLTQPIAIRCEMARSLFRILRHLPVDEFRFASPTRAAIPASPTGRFQSPQQHRSKAPTHELPFSLSQMGSGKKVKPIQYLQVPSGSPSALAAGGGSGVAAAAAPVHALSSKSTVASTPTSQDADLDLSDLSSELRGPVVHPLAMQILLMIFDPATAIRECVVEHLDSLIDPNESGLRTPAGPFFALFDPSNLRSAAAPPLPPSPSESVHLCFEQFIICLTHIQTNSTALAGWHHKLQRHIQATTKLALKQTVQGLEMDLRTNASTPAALATIIASVDCFSVNFLLTTFACIGQLSLSTPLGSSTQQLLLWPLIEALAHATEHAQTELQQLALRYFTRLAHAHRLTTNGFFFLHSQYLFEKIFHTQIQQTPELVTLIFSQLILQDGVELPSNGSAHTRFIDRPALVVARPALVRDTRTVDWSLCDLYREGVRITVPSMILRNFSIFCESGAPPILHQLAKSAAFSNDASMQTFLVSILDSVLSHVFRSPGEFTAGFIQNQLIPFFSVGLKSSVKQLLDFVVFVRSDVLFDLLWRMADERQTSQARQVINWIVQGDNDKAKAHAHTRATGTGKLHTYLSTPATSSAAPPPLTAAAAALPFALTAPSATEAQLSDLFMPYFLGVFTKLHALLTMTFSPISLLHPSLTSLDSLPVHVPHRYKVHAIHTLGVLLKLTKERLRGFVPKILASMQLFTAAALKESTLLDTGGVSFSLSGVSSSSGPLSFHLLALWSVFIDTLVTSNNIGEYLSTIVVTLVQAMGKLSEQQVKAEQAATGETMQHVNGILFNMTDFHAYRSSLPPPRVPKQSDKPNLFLGWISSLPEYLLDHALCDSPDATPTAAGATSRPPSAPLSGVAFRAHCIAHISLILDDLLLRPRPNRDLTPWLRTIPTLPNYPQLASIQALLQSDFQAESDRRMKELAKGVPTDVQHTSRHAAASSAAPHNSRNKPIVDEQTRSIDTLAQCAFYIHLDRILSTISHESDQVRNYTLKHFRSLLRDPIQRAQWESYCNMEIGMMYTSNSSSSLSHPRFTQLISALLQRCADSNLENKLLASECMGEIGAIDSGHLTNSITVRPPQQHSSHHRTVYLAHYLIHHLLVRSLRSAIETQSQDRALCAIQQLLKYCGIDRTVQEVAEKAQVQVSDKLQLQSRSQLEHELTRIIETRHASEYLPHAALGLSHQRTQVYQALGLWLDFPADVRAIITPCLTSAYVIQDQYLQPRATNQNGVSRTKEEEPNNAGGKKNSASARKRKDIGASSSSSTAIGMDIDDGDKSSKKRTTPDRKKPQAQPPPVAGADGSTTLNEANIRPLPAKALYSRKLTMPQWIAQFTRYLIVYTALPIRADGATSAGPPGAVSSSSSSLASSVSETLLYQACIGVVQSDVSIALFLLPYLVDHALRYGSEPLIEFIRREIMAVLAAHTRPEATSDKSVEILSPSSASTTSAHSAAQMCIQAVFELLDTLQQWMVAERRKIEAARTQQANAPPPGGTNQAAGDQSRPSLNVHYGTSSGTPTVLPPSAPFPSTRTIDAYKQFIDSIPKKVLANAAFQCKAFTRALKYMESHLREEKDRWKVANDKRQAAAQQLSKVRGRGTLTSALAAAASSSTPSTPSADNGDAMLTDGPGAGFLPSDLDSFQHMYASLDEPDGMRGLASLRQKQSVPSQIKDLESMGKWSEALTCYDHCLQNDSTQLASHIGMMECFRNLGQWQVGLNHAQAIIAQPNIGANQVRQVAVYAVQNAWRLRDWTTVEQLITSKQPPEPTHFEVRLAALLLALHKGDHALYDIELRRARKSILSPLTAASWESYERAYPYLLQLQMIAEVDQLKNALHDSHHRRLQSATTLGPLSGSPAYGMAGSGSASSGSSQVTLKDLVHQLSSSWATRMRRTTQTFRIREQILCLRRVLYSQFDLNLECGMGWLQLAHQAREAQQFEVAQGALMHASQMGIPNTFIERARLLRARGQLHDALVYLEKEAPPDMKDNRPSHTAQASSIIMSQGTIDASFRGAPPVVKPCLSATICLTLGKWIQESNAKESRDVINLYNKAIHFQPKWEKAHFLLGKYYDELLAAESNRSRFGTLHSKQQQQQHNHIDYDSRGKPIPSKAKVPTVGVSNDVVSKFLGAILKSYGSSLMYGHKYLFQSMPRILTLWFEHSENCWKGVVMQGAQIGGATVKATGGAKPTNAPNNVDEKFSQCHVFLCELTKTLPAYQWLTALPQIISRLTHILTPVYSFIKDIILKVFADYPQQTLWLLAPVNKSIDPARSARSREIIGAVRKIVPASTNAIIDKAMALFDQLIKISTYLPKAKRVDSLQTNATFRELSLMRDLAIIVPIQHQMTVTLPPLASDTSYGVSASMSMDTPINGSMSYDNHYQQVCKTHRAFPSHQVTIASFGNEIEVLKSKEKPKKLSVLGNDGRIYAFLCKKEIKGDMRKNSRMMEFNTVVNRLLKESGDSRTRHLSLRTFSVLPMTEECGLIEWVPNTTGFRHLVRQTHDEEGIQTCFITIKKLYEESSQQVPNDVANEIKLYERLCELYRPVFHKWFLTSFPEPYAWFQARLKYARSSAVWSMVGYIVGLGDRHGENILIDESNGDCVHVDFDCLFGKGLTLEKPERVPFRLTPNMVDALGICGVDGLFSSSAEVAMQVIRSNEQTMMSVLHTFIYDPLVEWKTTSANGGVLPSSNTGVTFHPNAVKILDEIEMKLRGQVAKESLPLNVHGQVAQLIKEATSLSNLAQMYIGWMAWL